MATDIVLTAGECLQKIADILEEDPDGGTLALVCKGDWTTALEWGREAPDSDMIGAAAYGVGETLTEALNALVGDLH